MLKGSCHCGGAFWTLEGDPGGITACNCSSCVRYGALWAYDYEGGRIQLVGKTHTYVRATNPTPMLEIHFCPTCANVLAWRGLSLDDAGRRRMAVNVRLAPAAEVANLPIDHFDGFTTFEDLPRDGKCVKDLWF